MSLIRRTNTSCSWLGWDDKKVAGKSRQKQHVAPWTDRNPGSVNHWASCIGWAAFCTKSQKLPNEQLTVTKPIIVNEFPEIKQIIIWQLSKKEELWVILQENSSENHEFFSHNPTLKWTLRIHHHTVYASWKDRKEREFNRQGRFRLLMRQTAQKASKAMWLHAETGVHQSRGSIRAHFRKFRPSWGDGGVYLSTRACILNLSSVLVHVLNYLLAWKASQVSMDSRS